MTFVTNIGGDLYPTVGQGWDFKVDRRIKINLPLTIFQIVLPQIRDVRGDWEIKSGNFAMALRI